MSRMVYDDNEESRFDLREIEWAEGILSSPAYTMPNGRHSWEVANEVRDAAYDRLVDHERFTA